MYIPYIQREDGTYVDWTPAEFFRFWGARRDYSECKALSEKLCMSVVVAEVHDGTETDYDYDTPVGEDGDESDFVPLYRTFRVRGCERKRHSGPHPACGEESLLRGDGEEMDTTSDAQKTHNVHASLPPVIAPNPHSQFDHNFSGMRVRNHPHLLSRIATPLLPAVLSHIVSPLFCSPT